LRSRIPTLRTPSVVGAFVDADPIALGASIPVVAVRIVAIVPIIALVARVAIIALVARVAIIPEDAIASAAATLEAMQENVTAKE